MVLAGTNAGAWIGAEASVGGMADGVLVALSLGLLLTAGRWLSLRDSSIVIKVIASWMIAIATLSMFVSLVPIQGYKPDHMD